MSGKTRLAIFQRFSSCDCSLPAIASIAVLNSRTDLVRVRARPWKFPVSAPGRQGPTP